MANMEFEYKVDDIEVKPNLCLVKTEIKSDTDGEDYDRSTDPLTQNINHNEEMSFLALGSTSQEETWNPGMSVKQEIKGEDFNQDGTESPAGAVFENVNMIRQGRPPIYHDETEEERLARERERNRLRKKRYRTGVSEEAQEKERERNRLYMRKIRATLPLEEEQYDKTNLETCYMSQMEENSAYVNRMSGKRKPVSDLTPEQLERQRERNRNYMRKVRAALYNDKRKKDPTWRPGLFGRRKPVIALKPEQLERQRERNRNYMRKLRASLTEEELQQRRERDRLVKRNMREMIKQQTLKLKHLFNCEQQWKLMREFYANQLQHYQAQNAQLGCSYLNQFVNPTVQDVRKNDEVHSNPNVIYIKEENFGSNVILSENNNNYPFT